MGTYRRRAHSKTKKRNAKQTHMREQTIKGMTPWKIKNAPREQMANRKRDGSNSFWVIISYVPFWRNLVFFCSLGFAMQISSSVVDRRFASLVFLLSMSSRSSESFFGALASHTHRIHLTFINLYSLWLWIKFKLRLVCLSFWTHFGNGRSEDFQHRKFRFVVFASWPRALPFAVSGPIELTNMSDFLR